MKTLNVYFILFIYCFDISLNLKQQRQDYIIQIQGQIDSVKSESHLFGLKFKRKLVANVFLFEEDLTSAAGVRVDIKGFKKHFANKIGPIKRREKVMVKYHTWRNPSSENPTFKGWLLQPIKFANKRQCWPYYGMDIQEAWSLGYTGHGVTVAVVDIGVDVNHTDLKRNIDKKLSYSFVDDDHSSVNPKRFRSYQESEEVTSHGTMAAGLIGGEFGNQKCSAGVAFNAKLAALKVFQLNQDYIELALQVGFAFSIDKIPSALAHKRDDIDIYSCSFNIHTKFKSATSSMKSALKEGVLKGRKGKGNIYVFSAGNRKGAVYDCNMEALANSIYTITISSVGKDGSMPSYAIPCATALASTYGDFNTLRGPKTLETTTHDDRCDDFKGTSASAALASGIIALTLQANQNLTWRDLQYIIVLSSTHDRLESTGQLMKNAAGLWYDSFFGFGLMNATAMVILARDWLPVPQQKQITVHETFRGHRLLNEHAFAVTLEAKHCEKESDCVTFLEHVQVRLKYRKKYETMLDIILCSPAMSCSFLLNRKPPFNQISTNGKAESVERNWNFSSVHFWGENPLGHWVLFVNKSNGLIPSDVNMQTVILTLYGTSSNPLEFNLMEYKDKNNSICEALSNLTEWYKTFKHLVFEMNPAAVSPDITHIMTTQTTEDQHGGIGLPLVVVVLFIGLSFILFCILLI